MTNPWYSASWHLAVSRQWTSTAEPAYTCCCCVCDKVAEKYTCEIYNRSEFHRTSIKRKSANDASSARLVKTMEQLLPVAAVLSLFTTEVYSSIQCYQCLINPPPGEYYNTTKRLCVHFDYSDRFVVDCPHSTMCMKQEFHLDIQDGVRIVGVLRDCAQQQYHYQDYQNGHWYPKTDIHEQYQEGCSEVDDKGEKATSRRYCYCRQNLCNAAPATNQEGYTDIMGVIVVFNLMKYINSLR
ncbi:uncharacterized protein LOC121728332 [Aricia agestis]|uniref:uncharacterized protein LOC121728332 n=1 Tax=Aricia agestis TaxID=91739 RepID=UPI001C203047|nr:uncharacterized protein LOC121728332 [Aricia agestis]